MKTFPLTTEGGTSVFAFEISNTLILQSTITHLLTGVDGVTDVRGRKLFSKSSDVHVEFRYLGQPFIVLEPFGDNSRYWIGPKDTTIDVGDIARLEAVFKAYRSPVQTLVDSLIAGMRSVSRVLRSRK